MATTAEELQAAINQAKAAEERYAQQLANAEQEHQGKPAGTVDAFMKYGRFWQEARDETRASRLAAENRLREIQGQPDTNPGQQQSQPIHKNS